MSGTAVGAAAAGFKVICHMLVILCIRGLTA